MKYVFVWWLELDREIVMHRKKANIRNIVKCSHGKCRRPAALLDHYFPFHDEMNRCSKHVEGSQFYKFKSRILSSKPKDISEYAYSHHSGWNETVKCVFPTEIVNP